jgi:hypothetical protein
MAHALERVNDLQSGHTWMRAFCTWGYHYGLGHGTQAWRTDVEELPHSVSNLSHQFKMQTQNSGNFIGRRSLREEWGWGSDVSLQTICAWLHTYWELSPPGGDGEPTSGSYQESSCLLPSTPCLPHPAHLASPHSGVHLPCNSREHREVCSQ